MGNNRVEVDADSLASEVEMALEGVAPPPVADPSAPVDGTEGAPVPTGEMTIEQAQAIAVNYAPGSFFLVGMVSDVVAPNWEITASEKTDLANSVSLALAMWFPNMQLPPKYMVLLGIGGSLWKIAGDRRDKDTGAFKPLRAPVEVKEPQAASDAPDPSRR